MDCEKEELERDIKTSRWRFYRGRECVKVGKRMDIVEDLGSCTFKLI